MAIADEITRLQNAKSDLKTSINAKTDEQHQITNELIDDYADFVDSIQIGGGDISEYFRDIIITETSSNKLIYGQLLKKLPNITISNSVTSLIYGFMGYGGDTIPLINTSNIKNFESFCASCPNLTTIPQLDTSNATNLRNMFSNCSSLTSIPNLNTSNVTNMENMFQNCFNLTTIPQLDTSKVTTFSNMFFTQSGKPNMLSSLPELDGSSCIVVSGMFTNSHTNFTDFGGIKDLGKAYLTTRSAHYTSYKLNLSSCMNLTEQSLINVLNKLYDIASLGVAQQDVNLGSTNIAKLTSPEGQQALANAQTKGWLVS